MTKRMMGLIASVVLMGSGAAFAGDQKKHEQQQTQSQGATGGSGMINEQSGNQLTGRVVKSDKKTVWIEHQGAIVSLKIDKNTQFSDPNLKRAQDLKEGDEIRASFEVRKTDNVATNISKSSGMGGSGTEMMSPDSSINESPGTLPSKDDGTGGSGSDLSSPDINKGTDLKGDDLGTGSDVSPKHSGDY